MKRVQNKLYFTILFVVLQFFLISYTPVNTSYCHTQSKAEYVMDIDGKKVFSKVNENEKLPIASTTKIVTALTVLENFDVNKKVKVPKNCVGIEGSSVYLKEGEELTVLELLYGLMLRSGNDCAECLANTLTTRQEFIVLMNKTAKSAGATSTNFTNPHGLHDNNHYSTAKDLCLITAKALKNSLFRQIVSAKQINISNGDNDYDRVLINKNKMLSFYEGCTGVKTGFTKKAGRCLVSSAERNGFEVVSVVINSPQMWERSTELLDNVYNNYSLKEIFNSENLNNDIFTSNDGKKFKIESYGNFLYPVKNGENNGISYRVNGILFDEFIKNPKENGIFEIFDENKLIFSQNIFTIISK